MVSVSTREKTVLFPPFGGSKMARKVCNLVKEVLNVVEEGISHGLIEWDCFHPSIYYFCDDGHCCRDHRHDRAVLALTIIT